MSNEITLQYEKETGYIVAETTYSKWLEARLSDAEEENKRLKEEVKSRDKYNDLC